MGFTVPEATQESPSKVVALVVGFCDGPTLAETLMAIDAQQPIAPHSILCIDNSPEPLDLPALKHTSLVVEHFPENPGLVAAVNRGIEWAKSQKADFLWFFDHDSLPSPNCLSKLLQGLSDLQKQGLFPGLIGPGIIEQSTGRLHHGYEFLGFRYRMIENAPETPYACDMILHSGSLLRLDLDPPLTKLPEWIFLDALEHSLADQVRSRGRAVAVAPQALMEHRFGHPVRTESDAGKVHWIHNYPPLRYYTICRNQTWYETRRASGPISKLRAVLYSWKRCRKLSHQIRQLTSDPSERAQKLRFCRLGTLHGIMGITDRLPNTTP